VRFSSGGGRWVRQPTGVKKLSAGVCAFLLRRFMQKLAVRRVE
jgi:hypothetical protein